MRESYSTVNQQRQRIPRTRLKPRRKRPDLFFERKKPAVFVLAGGREICNADTQAGRLEYQLRIRAMLIRQRGLCCNCRKSISEDEQPTFEHENGRGGGKRDDRIMVDGKPLNGASHLQCNYERGSKRTPIWHGEK
jgi:hypothetical protein